jgi:Zn-dependent peptidase ImmA (M78 family)/transcriptional regulator with XRE-family HTH domain
MSQDFDGLNLRLARSAHNLSLADVGEAVGKSKQFIQRLEAGRDSPTDDLREKLADLLKVEVSFFAPSVGQMLAEDAYHFRKLIGTKAADKQTAIAKGELFRRVVAFVDTRLKLPKFDFPTHGIGTPAEAERAAEKCRAHWGLGLGPIGNMIRVVENAGAVVTTFAESGREIDALSISSPRPIVVMNSSEVSACRARFGHAHEIAHFVGHEGQLTGDKGSEAEANRFAGAFLMPRSSFSKEFPSLRGGTQINWRALSELKFRWRVSKAGMLYRARQLGLLSEDQYRRAIVGHLYAKGERRGEDEDSSIPHEQPELLLNALRTMRDRLGISVEDVARAVHLKKEMLARVAPQVCALELPVTENEQPSKVLSLSEYRGRLSGRRA